MKLRYIYFMIAMLGASCQPAKEINAVKVRLVTLDPGHFHAALVQKSMYEDVDSNVYVYAPRGPDVQQHLDKIKSYNSALQNPTHWNEEIYLGDDFLQKMLNEKKGNVVVIAGNNHNKTAYIKSSVDAGLNVLADKPMAIDKLNFEVLKNVFTTASEKKLLLYDIMTERYEITNTIQREFSMILAVFGTLQKGTQEKPAVEMESVHFFYKNVSGNVLTRPTWFMDMTQQGEGMVDVGTHLVDLVQWECFPDRVIDYTKDIQINAARRWGADMTLSQFKAITKADTFPSFLKKDVEDSILKVYANGEIDYTLRGTHVKITARWEYKAPEGSGDTHYSILRGTKANLIIKQGAEQGNKPTLYLEPVNKDASFESILIEKIKIVQDKFPGVELKKTGNGWEIIIPEKYKDGHEAHFARVTQKFLEYLKNGNIPAWEVPNMIAKYFTTTEALAIAKKTGDNK